MCRRTSLFAPQPVVEARFGAEALHELRPRYNVAPGDDLAVITNEAPHAIDGYEWGLIPHWADDPEATHRPINARAESVSTKPFFRDAYANRRAMVHVDGYYEWLERRDGTKQPYRIARADGEPFALAGLWERWENGRTYETVTVVTTAANDRVRPIHDRMPVVLPPDRERDWLATDGGEDLLEPYPGDDLAAFPVSSFAGLLTAVGDRAHRPGRDDPDRPGQVRLNDLRSVRPAVCAGNVLLNRPNRPISPVSAPDPFVSIGVDGPPRRPLAIATSKYSIGNAPTESPRRRPAMVYQGYVMAAS